MTVRIAIVLALFLLPFPNAHAQEPTLLGRIQSDTMGVLFGRTITAVGDQNGDGCADFLVGDARPSTHLYFGGATVDSVAGLTFYHTLYQSNLNDVSGDGVWDFTMLIGTAGDYLRAVYFGGVGVDSVADLTFGTSTYYPDYSAGHSANLNGSGTDGLIAQGSDHWSVCLYDLTSDSASEPDLRLTPANLSYDGYIFGEALALGDFNGDGFVDLACNLRRKPVDSINGRVYLYWGGPSFDTTPDLVIPREGEYTSDRQYFGNVLVSLGDFNGDGWDDLYIACDGTQDTMAFLYWCGPGIDSIPDMTIVDYRRRAALAGDINNDGYPDLITSFPTSLSHIGWVSLYYGGPDSDSLPDIKLDVEQLPGFKTQFGMDVAGIGDFNGDGIDDFALSCIHAGSIGTVYIYAGFDGSTDAGGGGGVVLPVDFQLYQNYPNPFNPTTTIAFQLPVKSHVEIEIFNVLGQRVTTIVSAAFPAGSHSIVWDGTDTAGDDVASGVYVYRLTAGEAVLSRKMVVAR